MHGRPRKPAKAEDAAASAAKVEKLRLLQSQLLQNHGDRVYTREALDVSSRLIEVNPEVYTAWNYRKLAVDRLLDEVSDPADSKSILDGEHNIVEIALRRNPKCYGAWYHRKWVMERKMREPDFEHEFRLLDQLLKADSRNFHGWNYRRFVTAFKGVSEEEELKFINDKIDANFSNYSAWHNRSLLLSQLLLKKTPDILPKEKVLSEEFELVHQALFTDPDDQSGWFYYLWLLNQTITTYTTLLISSWPPNESILISSTNNKANEDVSYARYQPNSFLAEGILPILLYFNEAVKGVSSSTVIVQSSFIKNDEVVWKPLSTMKSVEAKFWITYIKVPELIANASDVNRIEVFLGHCEGITSSTGSSYNFPYRFGFTIDVSYSPSGQSKEGKQDLLSWENADFLKIETLPKETDVACLGELKISEVPPSKWLSEVLENEITLFRDLQECKIGKLTLARLLLAYMSVSSKKGILSEEVLEFYNDLMKLDPPHVRYYEDQKSMLLMDQITSHKVSLARHSWKRTKSDFLHSPDYIVLRLNNLSLSWVGFTERLLWVQELDLSHNELRCIEGLEALQLLSCLNLSNNRISSFSALEPLKLMLSLQVLNLSHNEIGAHPIDTARYLRASPLSHSAKDESDIRKRGGSLAWENWDALALFQDLHLKQLDIIGNAAATNELKSLIVRVLPTLKWLDGSQV